MQPITTKTPPSRDNKKPLVMRDAAWLRRVQNTLAFITVLGAFAMLWAFLPDRMASHVISFIAGLAACGAALAIRHYLGKTKGDGEKPDKDFLVSEAFHSTLSPQIIVNESGDILLANRAFRGWLGDGGNRPLDVLTKRFALSADSASEFAKLRDELKRGQSVMADLPFSRSENVTEWRRVIGRIVEPRDHEDAPPAGRAFYWRFEDISERRRMERLLREEKNKLLDFVSNAPVGIYSVDQHGRLRFVNETLAKWLQTTPDELVRGEVRLHDVIVSRRGGVAPWAIESGAQGETHGAVTLRRRDGSTFPVAISQTVARMQGGTTIRTRSVVRDLSPELAWQRALSVSEHRFQHLFAEAPIGIVLLDEKLHITECNAAFNKMLNKTREDIIKSSFVDMAIKPQRDDLARMLTLALDGKDPERAIETELVNSQRVMAQIFARHVVETACSTDTNGKQRGLVIYVIDATEQKRIEVQFAQAQKMQAIGRLAGGVAHDFNNLLTAMIGFCDLLLQRHKPGDQSFSDIMQIKQNGNRAANLVRQLLAFSRQQTLQPKMQNIVDLLSELTNLLRRLIGPQITLEVTHERNLGLVRVDGSQFEQVIINLVVNARDAIDSRPDAGHSGKISINTCNHVQTSSVLRGQDEMSPGNYVVIKVTDTGTGISGDDISRIFDPFFSTKELGSGTGLGLSTVYGIVRQTGGFIEVTSQLGHGSTFAVYLPVATPEDTATSDKGEATGSNPQPAAERRSNEENKQNEPPPTQDLTGAGTVLLVEDEDAVRVFAARALRAKGYQVHEANCGAEALKLMDTIGADVDVVVSDVVMPQMDGPTLWRTLRTTWPELKIIFISGYAEDRLREELGSQPNMHFLGKPFTLRNLAGKVKEVIMGTEE